MKPEVSSDAIQTEVDRILASETFRGAERSRALLRFIVEEAVQGRADRLKDYVLGSEALGRGEKFDPRTDPVARVEASRLRSRLDVYYANEGVNDPVRISLPKGGYAPAFEPRRSETPLTARLDDRRPMPQAAMDGRRGSTIVAAVGTVVVAAIAASIGWQLGRNAATAPPETRLDLVLPPTTDSISIALSPDGRSLVYAASEAGRSRLWVRSLQSGDARPLGGTEDAMLPFWSPDSGSIGFFADSRVKRLDVDTGVVRTVSTAIVPAGAAWNRDGVILHPIVPDSPLFRTTIDGAPAVPATQFGDGQTGHRGPAFLPDGRRFLFYASGAPAVSGIYVGELGRPGIRRLLDADAPAVVMPPDRILYVQGSALFLHRIDPDSVTLAGSPVRLADGVSVDALSGVAAISASADAIIYRTGAPAGRRQFMWIDRAGHELSRIGSPESGGGSYVSLSPDAKRLAVQRTVSGNTDIQIVDVERGTSIRFTTDPLPEIAPHWSPTGDRIAYAALVRGVFQLFEKPLGGEPRLLLDTPQMKQVTDWSQDALYLLFRSVAYVPVPDIDIWALPLAGDRTPFPVVRSEFDERDAQFSPDGTHIAYQSNSSGRFEIYVKPLLGASEPDRISKDGGVQVRWRSDGLGLYYINLAGELVAVPLTRGLDGRPLKFGPEVTLFRASVGPLQTIAQQSYLPSKDNTKFLMEIVIEEAPPPIRVVQHWGGGS